MATDFLHVTKLGDPKPSGLDPWHITGSSTFHKSDQGEEFLKKCQAQLPQLKSKFKTTNTGYPVESTSFSEDSGWTTDDSGRLFVCTPNYYIFQRMLNGHLLMYCDRNKYNWDQLFGEKLAEISAQI